MLERSVIIPSSKTEGEDYVEMPIIEEEVEEEIINSETIDKTNQNYLIHKGKIDCQSIDECIQKSQSNQLKFNDIIIDVTYLEVLSNYSNVLGYYIQYKFMNKQYETNEECQNVKEELLNNMSEYIQNCNCTDDNELIIQTGEVSNEDT